MKQNQGIIRESLPKIESFVKGKLDDAYKLYDYMLTTSSDGVSIEQLKAEYGGEPLRVDPILFELVQRNIIDVSYDSLGRIVRIFIS